MISGAYGDHCWTLIQQSQKVVHVAEAATSYGEVEQTFQTLELSMSAFCSRLHRPLHGSQGQVLCSLDCLEWNILSLQVLYLQVFPLQVDCVPAFIGHCFSGRSNRRICYTIICRTSCHQRQEKKEY